MLRNRLAQVVDRLNPRNGRLAITSTFLSSSILMYSCDPLDLERVLCSGLEVDVVDGRGHLAIAFVDQRDFRLRGLPRWVGRDFFMVEYLAFVRYESSDGRQMRGLYLLQSDTPSALACVGSRLFSHYRFRRIDLNTTETNEVRRFESTKAGIDVSIALDEQHRSHDWERTWPGFAELSKPRSFNFQHLKRSESTLIIRGVLKGWDPRPATVIKSELATLDDFEIAFDEDPKALVVENVEYLWRNSRIDR